MRFFVRATLLLSQQVCFFSRSTARSAPRKPITVGHQECAGPERLALRPADGPQPRESRSPWISRISRRGNTPSIHQFRQV